MSWKNWPYWVKGAIAGGIILPLLYIFIISAKLINASVMWPVILLFCTSPTALMSECLVAYSFSLAIALFLEFILAGIVLGYLYGKIKNRNSVPS